MIRHIRETAGFVWGWLRNDPEHMTRYDRWQVFRPYWTYTIFTTYPGCGCRKRFGLWRTIWCMEHCFAEVDVDD